MRSLFAAATVALCLAYSGAAHAEPAYISAGVNVRAGPGVDFPRVTTFARGARVDIQGCIANRQWCDVQAGRVRGWVSARYLDLDQRGGRGVWDNRARINLPTLNWNLDTYWDAHYRNQSFNRERSRYRAAGPQSQTPAAPQRSTQGGPANDRNSADRGPEQQRNCDDPRTPAREQCEP